MTVLIDRPAVPTRTDVDWDSLPEVEAMPAGEVSWWDLPAPRWVSAVVAPLRRALRVGVPH